MKSVTDQRALDSKGLIRKAWEGLKRPFLRSAPTQSQVDLAIEQTTAYREEMIQQAEEDFRQKDTIEDLSKEVSKILNVSLQKTFTGQPNTEHLRDIIQQQVMKTFDVAGLNHTEVNADVDSNDPTKINVTVGIQPSQLVTVFDLPKENDE